MEIPVFKVCAFLGVIWAIAGTVRYLFFSEASDSEAKRTECIDGLPKPIVTPHSLSAHLGWEVDLKIPIYIPDCVRSRHVHIIGATGSGKTESVLLNLIDQDATRAYPVVILDAKGDKSFVEFLRKHPGVKDRLIVFDPVKAEESVSYNPLSSGTTTEAAMRLFNSMTWSEEFYKTRCREMLLRVVEAFERRKKPLSLSRLRDVFSAASDLSTFISSEDHPFKISDQDYAQLSGLVAQINQLCHGELGKLIGGPSEACDAG